MYEKRSKNQPLNTYIHISWYVWGKYEKSRKQRKAIQVTRLRAPVPRDCGHRQFTKFRWHRERERYSFVGSIAKIYRSQLFYGFRFSITTKIKPYGYNCYGLSTRSSAKIITSSCYKGKFRGCLLFVVKNNEIVFL